jgi:hypothetical protein
MAHSALHRPPAGRDREGRLDADQDVQRVKDWLNSAYYAAVIETNFYRALIASSPLLANATALAVTASCVKIEYITRPGPTGTTGGRWMRSP